SAGWALACHSRVTGDVTVRVPDSSEEGARIVTEAAPAQTSAEPLEPLVIRTCVEVEPPSLENSFSDCDRLARALRRNLAGRATLTCGLGVLRALAAALRSGNDRVTVTVGQAFQPDAAPAEILRVEPGDQAARSWGLAIDIGTTTCAVQLVDLVRGHVVDTACDYNGQTARGLDVISRINYAKVPARREELRTLVLQTLTPLIEQLCRAHGLQPTELDCAAVAGNTTMIHLLLGLDPEYIRLEPYTPTVNRTPPLRAREVGLPINPDGLVVFAPGVGSYVGGDITAGLLRTALAGDSDAVRLFLDIGTNGEIVLGSREWLMACACSAGPAFEGGGIRCGMRAAHGAIERFRLDPATGQAAFCVIGGGKPKGICGSGMVDLLAELWAGKRLEPSGRFNPARCGALLRPAGAGTRDLAYVVVPGALTENGQDLVIAESDIQNLLRTKAAVYSACALMLKHAGLATTDLAQVYVAGGFGRFLDLRKSILIGMLPDVPLERFTYLGNSALAGAREMLLKRGARRRVQELADRVTYLELNVVPSYMEEYTAALFLPHTDLSRFPSARAVGAGP
ncbi:MAG: ASKHA domain-containing protein, partial [Planctomycetota bacterium]|nr:ASKHA domain-containing protein [Planctomycetota bacterium]